MSAHTPLVQQQKLWKAFFIFLMPLIATNILQNLSGTINTIFVGQMMGVQAIAAVAVFFPILFCLMAFVIGLSAGSTVLVGQAWGAQNIEKVRAVVGSTIFMTLIGGSFIAFLGVFLRDQFYRLWVSMKTSCISRYLMCNGCWQVALYCLYILFIPQFYAVSETARHL
jgi:Na+-driven multidrug efflux pump